MAHHDFRRCRYRHQFLGRLLSSTLKATREAIQEARRGSDAAAEAVAVTRTIGEAQVRGYPAIHNVSIAFGDARGKKQIFDVAPVDPCTPAMAPTIWFTTKNHGQSPIIFFWDLTMGYDAYGEISPGQPVATTRTGATNFPIAMQDGDLATFGDVLAAQDVIECSGASGSGLSRFELAAASQPKESGTFIVTIVIALAYIDVFKTRYNDSHAFAAQICNLERSARYQMTTTSLNFFRRLNAVNAHGGREDGEGAKAECD